MKVIKFIILAIILPCVIGYAIYYFGTDMASDKLVDAVTEELETSGQMNDLKGAIESDPELLSFVEEAKAADSSQLPFTTKEEATRVLIKKIGITELNEIRKTVQDGSASKAEILQDVQSKLTEEEIMALKVIAYKEIYGE